jgi:predicted metal-dependent peptidase
MTVQVPFFGHLLLKLEPVVTRRVPMAGVTRDRKLLVNPEWAMETRTGEFATTIVHEVLHLALLCFERQAGRVAIGWSPQSGPVSIWNLAHDYAINLIIEDMVRGQSDLVPPSDWRPKGLIDNKYRDWSAEEIYDAILKDIEKNSKNGKGPSQPGRGQPGQSGQGQGQGEQPPNGEHNISHMKDLHEGLADIQEGKGGGSGSDDGEQPQQHQGGRFTDGEKRDLDNYWKIALIEAAQVHEQQKGRGTLPGGVQKIIDSIIDPRIPWVDVLSRWVGENGRRADFTYRRPSRRSESIGELLPSLQKHGVDDIVVLWDTSGSMNGREEEIMSEVIGICQDMNMKLRVICVDAAIHSDQSDVEDPEDIDVKGGGGSDFRPAFDLLVDEGYQGVVIAFTDGYIGVPQTKPHHLRDCLWIIWEGDVDPTSGGWGEVLKVDDEGYAA